MSQCHLPGAVPGDHPPGDLGSPPEVQRPETILPETRVATSCHWRGLPCGESPPGQSGARRLSSRRLTAGAPAFSSVAQARGTAIGPPHQMSPCHLPGAAPGDYPPGDLGSPPEVQRPETILPETRVATRCRWRGLQCGESPPGQSGPGDYPPGDLPREPPPSVDALAG